MRSRYSTFTANASLCLWWLLTTTPSSTIGQETSCPIEIYAFTTLANCFERRPIARGRVQPDNTCRVTEVLEDFSGSGQGFQYLPRRYTAYCIPNETSDFGYMRFAESACREADCSRSPNNDNQPGDERDVCDRFMQSPASHYSRIDQDVRIPLMNPQLLEQDEPFPCYSLRDSSGQMVLFFAVFGTCDCDASSPPPPTRPPPSPSPTVPPFVLETVRPSVGPTRPPTRRPTRPPTRRPTRSPTRRPTRAPTHHPSSEPTPEPSPRPTRRPTRAPSQIPTIRPTAQPVVTARSTKAPTREPTHPASITTQPSDPTDSTRMTFHPTDIPTAVLTTNPSSEQSHNSATPASKTDVLPTTLPTDKPSPKPSSSSFDNSTVGMPTDAPALPTLPPSTQGTPAIGNPTSNSNTDMPVGLPISTANPSSSRNQQQITTSPTAPTVSIFNPDTLEDNVDRSSSSSSSNTSNNDDRRVILIAGPLVGLGVVLLILAVGIIMAVLNRRERTREAVISPAPIVSPDAPFAPMVPRDLYATLPDQEVSTLGEHPADWVYGTSLGQGQEQGQGDNTVTSVYTSSGIQPDKFSI